MLSVTGVHIGGVHFRGVTWRGRRFAVPSTDGCLILKRADALTSLKPFFLSIWFLARTVSSV